MIDARTGCVALFGAPVAHSLSPQMHNAAFAHLGLNLVYLAFEVGAAAQAAEVMRAVALRGASITVPHKEAIVAHLDEVDEVARAIGAVNTVAVEQGRLLGCNTDWLGMVQSLEQATALPERRCLVLGAGGAARAAVYALKRRGARVLVSNRTEARGLRLAEAMACDFLQWPPWGRNDVEVLINATTVGMWPAHDRSPVPAEWLRPGMVVLDLVYRPRKTRLLLDAETRGCRAVSGLEMLLFQGAAQLEIWTGRQAPVEVMRAALLEALEHETDQDH
jgi:shikimate dehydrogenase